MCTLEPDSWVKILISIRERNIIYITITFVSILVSFIIAVVKIPWNFFSNQAVFRAINCVQGPTTLVKELKTAT